MARSRFVRTPLPSRHPGHGEAVIRDLASLLCETRRKAGFSLAQVNQRLPCEGIEGPV